MKHYMTGGGWPHVIGSLAAFMVASAGYAQSSINEAELAETRPDRETQGTARTADTGVGEVGQRQKFEDDFANIKPLGRIENRIRNRVENRIRNRIDRDYEPTANATSPFEKAEERNRDGARTGRPQ